MWEEGGDGARWIITAKGWTVVDLFDRPECAEEIVPVLGGYLWDTELEVEVD